MRTIQKLIFLATAPLLMGATSITSYQPAQHPIYIIETIECVQATSGSDTDSIYISQQSTGDRYPEGSYSMSAGSKQVVGSYFYPSQAGELVMYEADFVSDDDEIGRFKFHLGEASGTYTVTMTGDGAEYIVTISVRR